MGYYDEQKKVYADIEQIIKTAKKAGVKKLNLNELIVRLTLEYAVSEATIIKRFAQLEKIGVVKIRQDDITITSEAADFDGQQ